MRTTSTRAVVVALAATTLLGTGCMNRAPHRGGHDHRTVWGPSKGGPSGPDGDEVSVDPGAVNDDSDEIQIDTPNGVVTAKRDTVTKRGSRDFTWFGRTPGRNGSNVSVTVKGGDVSAHVDDDEGGISVISKGDGTGLRTRIDRNVLSEGTDPEAQPDAEVQANEPTVTAQATGDAVIDVLIVYNSAVARSYGTTVQAVAQGMIDKANKSFTDSKIRLQYRLVRVQQVADDDIKAQISWFGRDNLYNLVRSRNVANLRNEVGADLVQAWGNYNDVCGQGYQPSVSQAPNAAYGFSVINNMTSCIKGQAVSHELGHNLGGGHDRVTSRRPSGGGDAYGLVDPTHRFLTIMAYPQSCGSSYYYCTQSWLFSNPNVQYNGYPTGVAGSVDNARVINIIGPKVANFRAPRV